MRGNRQPVHAAAPRSARGFTLLEAMVLMVVFSIVAVAAGIGLQSVAKVPAQADQVLSINNRLSDLLEQMRAEPWDTMTTKATSLSTTSLTLGNNVYPCTVTVASADADGGGVDADFRTITATVGSQSMSMLVTQP